MAEERVQAVGTESGTVDVTAVLMQASTTMSPERARRRTRAAGSPPASAKRLRRPLGQADSPEEQAKLDLSNALIAKYSSLVRQIAGGFQRKLPRNVLRDDLIAAGMSGLWDAVRKHGHEATGNFDWYVRVRIRGAILDELRAQDWLPRRARAAAAEAAASEDGSKASAAPVVLRFDEVSETEQARCLTA